MAPGLEPAVDRLERLALAVLVSANVAMPLLLTILGWPRPWRAFDGEESPINWFSSAQCAGIAVLAFAIYALTLLGRRMGSEPLPRAWPWAVFALGFLAMSADEALEGHERIRDEFLVPRGLFFDTDFMIAGDVVLLFFVLAGLGLSWFLFVELRRDRASLIAFFTAVALVGLSAFQDSLDIEFVRHRSVRHFQTIAEELAEIWAQMLFAGAFLRLLFLKLRLFLARVVPGVADPGGA
jgi:hypothetical protein